MTNFDMTPLYRSTIGFDRLANIFDALGATDNNSAFPPYNVARTGETDYRISMAVAGFAEDELEIIERGGVLRVRGGATSDGADADTQLLYRGIAKRNFEIARRTSHAISSAFLVEWRSPPRLPAKVPPQDATPSARRCGRGPAPRHCRPCRTPPILCSPSAFQRGESDGKAALAQFNFATPAWPSEG